MKEADAESELVSEAENRLSPHGKEQRTATTTGKV